MHISSLFTDKAYSFEDIGDNEEDKNFASMVLKKLKPNLKFSNIQTEGVYDDYDLFSLFDDEKQKYNLKISLDDSEGILKKESTALKNTKCANIPLFLDYCKVKVGEEVTCLLTKVEDAENIRNFGRSVIFSDIDNFISCYSNVFKDSKRVRRSYNSVLDLSLKNMHFNKFLPDDSIKAFASYTDYELCLEFLSVLRKELTDCKEQVKEHLNHKCHGNLCLEAISYNYNSFYFDFLHNVSMGHEYVDLVDIMLELGLKTEDDGRFTDLFCNKLGIGYDNKTYQKFYELQIRKKLAELLISYIKEVSLYDSFRYQKIFFIADTFSQCYKRFCSIDIFKKNREFIMKTICEPIFGVKA